MSARDLDAAGITDPALRASYETCRALQAEHGRTYYLAALLLPPAKRPYVHALYGFARFADELVDDLDHPDPAALEPWGDRILADIDRGHSDDPVGRALVHTVRTWDIPRAHFEAFLASMRMDLTVTSYPTYADLETYMYGSASVIGLEMVPVLEPLDDEAPVRARALGDAFQLSNFIRDVAEDLDRGRVYLPAEDLERFGVTRDDLVRGPAGPRVVDLLRFEADRTRALYRFAEPGIAMLHPTSRDCVRTALELYRGILDEVERCDYQVLDRRAVVPARRRLAVAGPALVRAWGARRRETRWRTA